MDTVFTINDIDYEYSPLDNITGYEVSKIMEFIFGVSVGVNIDVEYYFEGNDLMKHLIRK